MTAKLERGILTALVAGLLGIASWFRLMRLSSVPGISGDEGWWGIQALAWLSGGPYEAHTTSGNPTDLFFLVPVALVHTLAPPSFLLLRVVPAFVNLLALPVGFWLVRRLYGSPTAWIYTVALAIMPTAIAHSRICQDPSQSVFWTGIFIFICLLGFKERERAWIYLGAAAALFPVVLWTHPTNVFAVPFLLLPALAAIAPLLPTSWTRRAILAVSAVGLAALGAAIAWPLLRHLPLSSQYLDQPWLSTALARLTDARQWLEFAANNVRLFNGVTIYHYFSGARPPALVHDAAFMLAVVLAAGGIVMTAAGRNVENPKSQIPNPKFRQDLGTGSALDCGLIAACTMMWIGFYLFAGPQALRPHFERWGLCLIVPGTLVLARGLSAWLSIPRMRWVTIGTAAALAVAVSASFYSNYFGEFARTGGRSHLTYVTAATEPKQQAFEHILSASPGQGAVAVGSHQWWLYKPLTYLATVHPHILVSESRDVTGQPGYEEALTGGRLFFVEFAETPELTSTMQWIQQRGLRVKNTAVRDASGRNHLEILQVSRP